MQKIIFFLMLSLVLTSCDKDNKIEGTKLKDNLYTAQVDFKGSGRIFYQKTGPTWDDPDIDIGETLLVTGDAEVSEGFVIPSTNEMPAYCSDSTPIIVVYPKWRTSTSIPEGSYQFTGTLVTSEGTSIPLFDATGVLSIQEDSYASVEIVGNKLPKSTARIYNLIINTKYTTSSGEWQQKFKVDFAQVWRCPIHGTPLYKKIIKWGSSWINGKIEDKGINSTSENEIAEKLLTSMSKLVDLGYRYGPFPRPSDIDDRAEVFLDFKQSACGEFRGFFMALTETQGVDSNWLWFWFSSPSSTWYSMYETRKIAALGTEPQVWRYADHVVTEVNGVVYDPTYLIIKQNADEYEDFMFARFCYGEDRACTHAGDWCTLENGPQGICIDNPPGYDASLGLKRYRGEDYN